MKNFDENMVKTMKKNKAKNVYINKNGEWLFHPRKGYFPITSNEVLSGKQDDKTTKLRVEQAEKEAAEEEAKVAEEIAAEEEAAKEAEKKQDDKKDDKK